MSNTPVSSLRWLTDSQQATLASMLAQACQSILREWRCGTDSPETVLSGTQTMPETIAGGSSFEVVSDAGRLMTIRLGPDWSRQLLNLPGTSALSTGISTGLLTSLERDFVEALARRIIPPVLAPGLSLQPASRHSDEIVVKQSRHIFQWALSRHVSCGCFVLDGKLVDQLVPRVKHKAGEAPGSRRSAIGGQQIMLQAHVGHVDVSFSALQTLTPGDVLVLEAPLSELISLRSETGQLVAVGNLGQQENHRVVRLSNTAANGQVGRVSAAKRSIQ